MMMMRHSSLYSNPRVYLRAPLRLSSRVYLCQTPPARLCHTPARLSMRRYKSNAVVCCQKRNAATLETIDATQNSGLSLIVLLASKYGAWVMVSVVLGVQFALALLVSTAAGDMLPKFPSSLKIHTAPSFELDDWIKIRLGGDYEVCGTVKEIGWWSSTIITDDREEIHIPNTLITDNIVMNLTRRTHWRIKENFVISLLDINKIKIIMDGMDKVLSNNPQIEQQEIHRRVNLKNIDLEKQTAKIRISCFVKTSKVEEYLCVKDAVLLDLLTVVRNQEAEAAKELVEAEAAKAKAATDLGESESDESYREKKRKGQQ